MRDRLIFLVLLLISFPALGALPSSIPAQWTYSQATDPVTLTPVYKVETADIGLSHLYYIVVKCASQQEPPGGWTVTIQITTFKSDGEADAIPFDLYNRFTGALYVNTKVRIGKMHAASVRWQNDRYRNRVSISFSRYSKLLYFADGRRVDALKQMVNANKDGGDLAVGGIFPGDPVVVSVGDNPDDSGFGKFLANCPATKTLFAHAHSNSPSPSRHSELNMSAPTKRKAEQEAKRKAAEAKKQAAAKKAEQQVKAKLAAETALRRKLARRLAELKKELQQDAHASFQGPGKAKMNREIAQYSLAIRQKVEQNWLRPPGVNGEVKCQVTVEQSPAGDVLSVKLDNSCGSSALNLSVKNAVRRASPLPAPPSRSVFQRTIVFNFDSSGS